GYWLVASDGGIFSFGDAHFFGSAAGTAGGPGATAMAASPDAAGYLLVPSSATSPRRSATTAATSSASPPPADRPAKTVPSGPPSRPARPASGEKRFRGNVSPGFRPAGTWPGRWPAPGTAAAGRTGPVDRR